MLLPWAMTLGVEYVGQHSFYTFQTVNVNAIDLGTAFLPENQDPTLAAGIPGATARSTDLLRALRGYGTINQIQQRGWNTYHSIQLSINRRFRNGLSFGFNDTMGLSEQANTNPRLQHNPDGSFFVRADQALADELLGAPDPQAHIMKGNFVWDLPDISGRHAVLRTIAVVANNWQLSGIWTGATGAPYTVGFSYQSGGSNANLTGSADYGARIRLVGDPGAGCSGDTYRQFNTAAFQGPLVGSLGLESGNDYLRGCFTSVFDLAIARNIRLGGGRQVQLRLDMFKRAELRDRHEPQYDHQPGEPERSGHGHESSVRRRG